jgi:dCTP diphosphatase
MAAQKTLTELAQMVVHFRDQRDWKQFHTAKDMALSLVLEASETAEIFQWQAETDLSKYTDEQKQKLGAELSDVLYWALLLAHDAGINLGEAFGNKMLKNEAKYPVEKARGSSKKYSEL